MAAEAPVLFESKLQPVSRWLRAIGRKHPRASIKQRFAELAARFRAWFGDADVMLSPTSPVLPPRVGAYEALPPEEAFRRAAEVGAFTAAWNVAGQPAASLPLAFSRSGLPIGVQLVGRAGEDETVLALSRQLETPEWRKRPGER
jgi:amidase